MEEKEKYDIEFEIIDNKEINLINEKRKQILRILRKNRGEFIKFGGDEFKEILEEFTENGLLEKKYIVEKNDYAYRYKEPVISPDAMIVNSERRCTK